MVTSNKDAAKIWKMIEEAKSSNNTPDRGPNDLEERIEDLMKVNLSHHNLNADLRKEVRYQTDQAKFYKIKAEQLEKENKELRRMGANFIGTTHMTFSAVAADPTLMKNIADVNRQHETGRWLATNLGIETVSPPMVKKHLGVKTRPFSTEEWGSVVREGAKILNENHWFPAATIIIGWPDETPDDSQYTIDMMNDFREMDFRGLVAPLLYQDFSEKNSMHFGNLNEAQFTLFWRCWENNLRVINDIIPIILRNKTYGPPMKVFMYGILKAGTWAIMRYLRGLCKDLFNGRTPDEIIEKYSRSRSVSAPRIQTKKL